MTSKGRIICICAHSDDQIFGPGGTLAKYAKEGKHITTIIMSYGEMSHPHFQEEIVIKTRVEEAMQADKIIGGSGVLFLGLKEGKFREDAKEKKAQEKLIELFKHFKPEKIFMHSNDDTHPDHRATFDIVKEAYDNSEINCPVYTFDVWAPFSIKKRDAPRIIINVSSYYTRKLRAISCFKSQLGILQMLNWYVYTRMLIHNLYDGLRNGHQFAEVFYRFR